MPGCTKAWAATFFFQGGISGSSAFIDQSSNFLFTITGAPPQSAGGTTNGTIITVSSSTDAVGDENATVSGTPSLDIGSQVGFNYTVGSTTAQVRYTIQAGDALTNVTAGIVAAAQASTTLKSIINGVGRNGTYWNGINTIVQESAGVFGFDVLGLADPTLAGNGFTGVSSSHVTVSTTPVGYYFGGPAINIGSGVVGRDSIVGDVIYAESVSYPNSSGVNAAYQTNTYSVLNAATPSMETTWKTGGGGFAWVVGGGRSTFSAINTDLGLIANGTSANNVIITSGSAGSIDLTPGTGAIILNGPVSPVLGSDATGDLYYRNSGGNLARLGLGSTNNGLIVSGGLPAWGPINLASSAAVTGTLPYANGGTNAASLAQAQANLEQAFIVSVSAAGVNFNLVADTALAFHAAGRLRASPWSGSRSRTPNVIPDHCSIRGLHRDRRWGYAPDRFGNGHHGLGHDRPDGRQLSKPERHRGSVLGGLGPGDPKHDLFSDHQRRGRGRDRRRAGDPENSAP